MTTMASALYLQSHGAPSHSTCTSSSSSPKLAQNGRITVALSNCKLRARTSFKSLHFTVLQRKRSCCVIQAQQSSIADSEYQAGARRNIGGNLIGKEEETSSTEEVEDPEQEKAFMIGICDELIKVFMLDKPNTSDWRKLMAFSEKWNYIRPHFFERCRERADAETDLERKQNLLRLSRKLKAVDDDVQRHDELLNKIQENPLEINAIVAKRRKDFTRDFFEHLKTVCDSYYSNLEARNELARIGAQCLTAVEAYDNGVGDNEARLAQVKFDNVLNSSSLEAATKKIDNLTKQNQLDPSMMSLSTKAWAGIKESSMMKDEVKDIMYHSYMSARGSLQQLVPKEVRIMKYLLTLEDPKEQFTALTEAFSPGDEKPGDEKQEKDVDMLYTTPKELHKWIVTVLDAYYNKKQGTLIQEARKLMKPTVIQKLEVLKGVVEAKFM